MVALQRMKVDILPRLGAPAVYAAQPYGGTVLIAGLSAADPAGRFRKVGAA
jgi:hypothetical protein